jgi:hypothetical protein
VDRDAARVDVEALLEGFWGSAGLRGCERVGFEADADAAEFVEVAVFVVGVVASL